jgi:hypothetical protein
MRYASIFCCWSKRLKPSENRRAFIPSAGFRFAAMLTSTLGVKSCPDGPDVRLQLTPKDGVSSFDRTCQRRPAVLAVRGGDQDQHGPLNSKFSDQYSLNIKYGSDGLFSRLGPEPLPQG